jgi:hypothetical protein
MAFGACCVSAAVGTIGQDQALAARMRSHARTGWYTGDEPSLLAFGAKEIVDSRAEPELVVSLLLSRDKMHHSVGWWRNAEYEYCWHLSISAVERLHYAAMSREVKRTGQRMTPIFEECPREDVRHWSQLIFGAHIDKLWNEPGGTDPRLSAEERRRNALIWHLRLFLDPETFEPFIPTGEVYDLTRWIPGLTPEKVDR